MSAPVATMKAVVYDKPFEVAVRQVKKPLIQHPDDIIVRGQFVSCAPCAVTMLRPWLSDHYMHLRQVRRTLSMKSNASDSECEVISTCTKDVPVHSQA